MVVKAVSEQIQQADSLRLRRSVKGMDDGFWDTNLRGGVHTPGPT